MKFRVLPVHLTAAAESTFDYFRRSRGFSSMKVEEEIIVGAEFRPTFSRETANGEIYCIEIRENTNLDSIMPFVRFCTDNEHYVKLYIAVPDNAQAQEALVNIQKARRHGVGVLFVQGRQVSVINEAVPLPLTGVRSIIPTDYPRKYRQDLATAEQTFRSGNPSKGCSDVFDLVEALTRNIASEALAHGLFRKNSPSLNIDVNTGPLARIAGYLSNNFDNKLAKCPDLKSALFARVQGMTLHRNESGHKVSKKELVRRKNLELKTRFEGGCDLLRDLIAASGPMKMK